MKIAQGLNILRQVGEICGKTSVGKPLAKQTKRNFDPPGERTIIKAVPQRLREGAGRAVGGLADSL